MADTVNNIPESTEPKTDRRGGRRRPISPRVTVSIDETMIDNAIRRDSRHCMIAEAIQALLPGMTSVTVDVSTIRFSDPKKRLRYVYYTPPRAAWAIVHFDQGIKPDAFTFNLRNASTITRTASGKRPAAEAQTDRAISVSTRNARKAAGARARSKQLEQISAPNLDEPFEPPKEYREQLIRAMDDPEANLGPALAMRPPNGDHSHRPVVVGGNPPPRGNLAKTRRFGLRELRE